VFILPPELVETSGDEQTQWQVIDEVLTRQQMAERGFGQWIDPAECMFCRVIGVNARFQALDIACQKKSFTGIQPAT